MLPEKKCIYTVVTAGYDAVFPPLVDQPGWDLLYFTDDVSFTSDYWDIRPLPDLPEFTTLADDPTRQARLVKILAHRFLQEYDYSVFVDGNRIINGDIGAYVESHDDNRLLCLESSSADAYALAEALLNRVENNDPMTINAPFPLSEVDRKKLCDQVEKWKKAGLPEWEGCPGTAILGRQHNDPDVIHVMESWAAEVVDGCPYDEPSLPYACFLHGFSWTKGLAQYSYQNQLFSKADQLAVPTYHRSLLLGQNPPSKPQFPKNPPPPGGEYNGYPLLLTIGVPVSNQIGTIRRCLEGIKPILDSLPSELIVVDTGSTDGTVEVCREFGARVIEFPWINDMSTARNQAIRAARGMWYMSIDDDEWFEDTGDIIHFFQNPLYYNKAEAVDYIQHNYLDEFGKNEAPTYARRIAKMSPDLHFEGRIHDALYFGKLDIIIHRVSSRAYHFGFQKTYRFEERKKTKRNISSLKYDVAQFPQEDRYLYQMMREYFIEKSHRDALYAAFWGLSVLRQTPSPGLEKELQFIAQTITAYFEASAYREALTFSKMRLDPDLMGLGDLAYLYAALSSAAIACESPHLALQYNMKSEAYIKRYNLLTPEEQIHARSKIGAALHAEELIQSLLADRFQLCIRISKHDLAAQLILLPEMEAIVDKFPTVRTQVLVYILRGQRWELLEALLKQRYNSSPDSLYTLYTQLNETAETHHLAPVLSVIQKCGFPPSSMEALLSLRQLNPDDPNASSYMEQLMRGIGMFVPDVARYFKMYALFETLRLRLDTQKIFDLLEIADIDYIGVFLMRVSSEQVENAYRAMLEWFKAYDGDEDVMAQYLSKQVGAIIYEKRKDEIDMDSESYLSRFKRLIAENMQWNTRLYRDQLLEGKGDRLLPRTVKSICLVHDALKLQQAGEQMEALRDYKEAIEIDSTLTAPVELLAGESSSIIEQELAKSKAQKNEFTMLLQSIKPKISQLIDAGMLQEASQLLAQLETLAPDDPELIVLKHKAGLTPLS